MIEEFTRELEAVGGHVHHGRAALEELAGEGVSVTPCLALIAETGTAVVSARLSAGRRRGLVDPVHVIEATHPADLTPTGVHHTEWTEVRGDTTVDARFRMHIDRITADRLVPVAAGG